MRVAVFRALQLGDLLCAVPALRALKSAHPRSRVTLVGLPWAAELAARFRRYVDDFVAFPGWPGLRERECDVRAIPAFLDAMRSRELDLALQLHGDGRVTNAVVALFGAKRTAGFFARGDWCPDPDTYLEWRPREHEVRRPLRLLSALAIPARGEALEFPLTAADRREAAAFGLSDYACVHPGAQLASRRWLPERFAAVADALAAEGLRVALTGTAAEAPLTRRVAQAMRAPALDLAGRTSLGGLAGIVAGARLLVSNDTGLSHVAAAVGTPSVVVCCGADPARWAPLDAARHRVLAAEVACRPCLHAECPVGHPCARGVTAEEVIRETRGKLACAA